MKGGEGEGKGEEPLVGLKPRVGFIMRQMEAGKRRFSLKNLNIPSEEPDVFVISASFIFYLLSQ